MAAKKKKPIGKLVNHVATRLQLLVRLKASDDNGYSNCVRATSSYIIKSFKAVTLYQGGQASQS